MTSAATKYISLLILASLLVLNFPVQINKAAPSQLAPPAATIQAVAGQGKIRGQRSSITILGQVQDSAGQPASGVRVQIVVRDKVVAETLVAGDGHFYFPPLAVDRYQLQVLASDGRPLSWVGNQPFVASDSTVAEHRIQLADSLTLEASDTAAVASRVTAKMLACPTPQPPGQIAGVVTAADTGLPLRSTTVKAYSMSGVFLTSGFTDEGGHYAITGLAPGMYNVKFEPAEGEYAPEWYNNQINRASATAVAVNGGATTANVNAALEIGGQISGRITAADTGLPLADVSITAYDAEGDQAAIALVEPTGVYTLSGLATGGYRLKVEPYSFGSAVAYLAEYYNDQATLAMANVVNVTRPSLVNGINVILARGAQITGRITAEDTGLPLDDVSITLYDAAGDSIAGASTNASGVYTMTGVATGSYRLQVAPFSFGVAADYIAEYYNDKLNLSTADPLNLTAPTVLTNINAALTHGGRIKGRVSAAENGAPLDDISVSLYNNEGDFVTSTATDATGTYTVSAVATGSYRVRFEPFGAAADRIAEYYNDQSSWATADIVAITAPSTVSGIDAALARGAQITGCVTVEESGTPMENVSVYVYDGNSDFVTSASTNADGIYSVKGLRAGSYRLEFVPFGVAMNYRSEYYNDKPTLATADAVVVGPESSVTGIDASLARGAAIRGRVTAGDTNLPLEDVYVSIYDGTGRTVKGISTDATGAYTVTGLATGSYRVRFEPFDTAKEYIAEYYDDKADLESADAINLTVPNVVSADAVLRRGGRISGHLTAADTNLPLADVYVDSYIKEKCGSFDRYNFVASTTTDSAGNYTLTGLPGGAYLVDFSPDERGASAPYIVEYYDNQASLTSAEIINVTAPNLTSGINAVLDRGGQITGRVTAADTGLPLDDVWVDVYDSNGNYAAFASVAPTGVYTTPGLPTGSYRLEFEPYSDAEQYAIEYYNNKADPAAADAINVTAPNVVSGVDAVLAPGGQIGGQVTAAGGAALSGAVIVAYTSSDYSIAFEQTDELGRYTLMSLPTGNYRVEFSYTIQSNDECTTSGVYISEYYNDQSNLAAANPITVNAPQAVTGIDAILDLTPTPTPPGGDGQDTRSYLPLVER